MDENKLPAYFLPSGRYKLRALISIYGKKIVDTYTGFELITYSSEKQKKNADG